MSPDGPVDDEGAAISINFLYPTFSPRHLFGVQTDARFILVSPEFVHQLIKERRVELEGFHELTGATYVMTGNNGNSPDYFYAFTDRGSLYDFRGMGERFPGGWSSLDAELVFRSIEQKSDKVRA